MRPRFSLFYDFIIHSRKQQPTILHGETVWLHNSDEFHVIGYLRRTTDEEFLITVNLTDTLFCGSVELDPEAWEEVNATCRAAVKSVLAHFRCSSRRIDRLNHYAIDGVVRSGLPEWKQLKVENVDGNGEEAVIYVSSLLSPRCPACLGSEVSYHSVYMRALRDLPWQGRRVEVRLRTRRFRCRNSECDRKVSAERISGSGGVRAAARSKPNARVIGVDDWAWRKR